MNLGSRNTIVLFSRNIFEYEYKYSCTVVALWREEQWPDSCPAGVPRPPHPDQASHTLQLSYTWAAIHSCTQCTVDTNTCTRTKALGHYYTNTFPPPGHVSHTLRATHRWTLEISRPLNSLKHKIKHRVCITVKHNWAQIRQTTHINVYMNTNATENTINTNSQEGFFVQL